MIPIHSPKVRREAQLFGISDLQAWRKVNAREVHAREARRNRKREARRAAGPPD